MRRTSSALLASGLALASSVVAFAPAADADHGSGGLPNRDNNNQDFDSHSLSTQSQIACSHGKTQIDNDTEITAFVGPGDVHCYNSNQGSGDGGFTICSDTNYTLNRCDDYDIVFNTYYQTVLPLTDAQWKSIGCHEVGHTSNIGHRYPADDNPEYSCMRTGSGLSAAGFPTGYDFHDVNEINGDA